MPKKALLVVTPFCSPNYVYPGAAYLTRYLRRQGYAVDQVDLSIEMYLRLFSRAGLTRVFDAAALCKEWLRPASLKVLGARSRYLATVEPVIRYLQGRDQSLAYRLCQPGFLPRGENLELNRGFDANDGAGNTIPIHDRAKFLGTMYLYDLAGLIRDGVFPYFQISMQDNHYDAFVHWCATFDAMHAELERPPNVLDQLLHEILDERLAAGKPDLVGASVPFARNLYWALRIGRRAKERLPGVAVAMGGGLVNTSMRRPNEPRLFDYVDYVTLDDGERPLQLILDHLDGARDKAGLRRTFYREGGEIRFADGACEDDAPHEDTGIGDYSDFAVSRYLGTLETINVNQRASTDGWWNKMTMAHGCYWKKCAFCDIHLSYIKDYQTAPAKNLVDKVEEAIAQTGQTGFHFVDEALPPKSMRDFALEVLKRGLHISWFGMLRFDKTFTPDLCRLLAASGLIAIYGGLEVASNRILDLMKKGTTVEQVAQVARNFQDAGTRVHAYIMYGFPTQTAQETVDALDVVRQLFKHRCLTSASWAKFGVTPHSPIGRDPKAYGIELLPVPAGAFIEQIIGHNDPANDHDRFTSGLENALKFFALGFHHDTPVEGWFDFTVPAVSIDRDLVGRVLRERPPLPVSEVRDRRAVWLGGPLPEAEQLVVDRDGLALPDNWSYWLQGILPCVRQSVEVPLTVSAMQASWRAFVNGAATDDIRDLTATPIWQALRERGLALV